MVNRLPNFGEIRRIVAAFRSSHDYKEKWRDEMYEHRFRNLFFTLILVCLFGFFLMIGLFVREGFLGPIQRWVLIVASTMFYYIVLIIRGR